MMAAIGFMLGVVNGELSAASVLGGLAFLMLGAGMLVGMFRMSRDWEGHDEGAQTRK
jgi:hypothetical protein